MKKILIIHSNMEIGGAESSLIGLLQSIDYSKYSVDLLLLENKGEFLPLIPKEVNILTQYPKYKCLALPIKDVLLKYHSVAVTISRVLGKVFRKRETPSYTTKLISYKFAMPFMPKIKDEYDMAISFIDPHYIIEKKVNAKVKLGWLHTDFSRVTTYHNLDFNMWNGLDYIVNVSDSCKEGFDSVYPELKEKSIVLENILSKDLVIKRAGEFSVSDEMSFKGIKILSIGRYSNQKNFDNVPEICSKILKSGLDVCWYIIGFGSDEALIKSKIEEFSMQENVILLGKKENPYPYIKECDIYAQPSRYEGKSVTVREAQMLSKPVVITAYATSKSQLTDGVDGVISSMDNDGCANKIIELLNDKELMTNLSENCTVNDYSNAKEIEKLYSIMEV